MAVIVEHGIDPRKVFQQAADARLADRRGGVHFVRHGKRESLYCRNGVLIASLEFEGGVYEDGELSLWGNYPEALTTAAKGLLLSSFIDHPLLRAPKMTIIRSEGERGALRLYHKARLIPVEVAHARHIDRSEALAA